MWSWNKKISVPFVKKAPDSINSILKETVNKSAEERAKNEHSLNQEQFLVYFKRAMNYLSIHAYLKEHEDDCLIGQHQIELPPESLKSFSKMFITVCGPFGIRSKLFDGYIFVNKQSFREVMKNLHNHPEEIDTKVRELFIDRALNPPKE